MGLAAGRPAPDRQALPGFPALPAVLAVRSALGLP